MLAAITALLKTLSAALGFGEKVVAAKHDEKQREAGRNEIIAGQNAETAKVNEDVAKAAVNSSDRVIIDSLRRGEF